VADKVLPSRHSNKSWLSEHEVTLLLENRYAPLLLLKLPSFESCCNKSNDNQQSNLQPYLVVVVKERTNSRLKKLTGRVASSLFVCNVNEINTQSLFTNCFSFMRKTSKRSPSWLKQDFA